MPIINWVKITTFLQSVGSAPESYIPIGAIPVDDGDAPFAGRTKVYASPTEMLDDGWSVSDAAYLAAIQYFGQTAFTPTPPTRLVIIQRQTPQAQAFEFTVGSSADGDYKLFISKVGGTAVEAATYTAATDTEDDIKAGLIAAFNLGPFAASHTAASSDTAVGSVTADVDGVPFVLTATGPSANAISIEETATNIGLYDDLDEAFDEAPFWAVIPDPSEDVGVMNEAARWAEASALANSARRNIAILQTNDSDIVSATEPNFASDLVGLGYTRSFPVVHANLTDKMSAVYFGRYGAQDPGTRAWHFGRVSGSSETSNLRYTQTEVENAKDQRVSIVERDGNSVLDPLRINWGMGSGGFFIVQKQAEDAWWFACGQALVRVLESQDGVNLDEDGLNKLVAAVDEVNASFGTGDTPVLDLEQTTTVAIPLEDVPASEREVGDYQTTGGIEVTTVLTPKIRAVRVSAAFALA